MTTTPDAPLVQPEAAQNGAALLDQVRKTLTQYAVLTDKHERSALTLWVAATHAVPAWEHAPRLIIRPSRGSGRSHLVPVVEALTPNPVSTLFASSQWLLQALATSPDDPPTLLIDEADRFLAHPAEAARDLRAVLSAGFERGRYMHRYNAAKGKVETIPAFAMAAIITPAALPPDITERAVTVTLHRPSPGQLATYRTRREHPVMDALRDRLNAWLRADLDTLRAAVPALPVEDRAADLWEPLIAVADLAGGHWPATARTAARALTTALTV